MDNFNFRIPRALYFKVHTCCCMLMMWGTKATVHTGSFICIVVLVVEVRNKLIWTWPGWMMSHKNLAVDQDVKNPIQVRNSRQL